MDPVTWAKEYGVLAGLFVALIIALAKWILPLVTRMIEVTEQAGQCMERVILLLVRVEKEIDALEAWRKEKNDDTSYLQKT